MRSSSDESGLALPPQRWWGNARHAFVVVAGFTLLYSWFYLRPILEGTFLAESDLYEYYLPIFLAPITRWSHFEFGGLPAFADPGDFTAYPPHFLFARIIGSWTALSISAFVMASCFTYAYVYHLTRSAAAAAFAGLAYGMSEAMMERLPHPGTLHAFAWLPLLLLAIEQLVTPAWRRWTAIGALAVACCFLAGHPQPAIYVYYCGGLYALCHGWAARADRGFYARVAGIFVIGGLLAGIKALPFVEASFYMAREETSFGQFTSHANSLAQMWSLLFPTILHEGREAPTYVGLLTLALALLGVVHAWRSSWRIPFWAGVTAFALLMGVGSATPVARLAYHIPLYGNFRASARHLFLAAFGMCLFAGFGVVALQRGEIARRAAVWAAGTLLGAVAVGAAAIAAAPHWFQFEFRDPLPWALPIWSGGVWVQFTVAAATAVVVVLGWRSARAPLWMAMACALLFVDTLYSLPYRATPAGLVPGTVPPRALVPSVHATALGHEVEPLRQRVLAPGGTHRDAVIPAAWARLWEIPIAGGYGPMLLGTHNAIAQMGTNGSVRPSALAPDDVGLDILAVGRVVLKAEDLVRPPTFERDGLTWSLPPLGLTIGRADDCGHSYERRRSLPLPRDLAIAQIAIVAHMRCLEDVADGATVLNATIRGRGGIAHRQPLRAGAELAERELSNQAVATRARHARARVFDDPALPPFAYLARIEPLAPLEADRLELVVPPIGGWITIERVTVVDADGRSHPQTLDDLTLGDAERWAAGRRFATSRVSDRGHDEAGPEDSGYVVLENRRALPRAWMVEEVVPVDEASLVQAIRHSQLPGGRPFDPRQVALVDAAEHSGARRFTPGASSVTVRSIQDGQIKVDVTSNGGYLVLSETFYPGWQARIGGTRLAVERANLGLQGVVVPAGQHLVEFEFDPMSLRLGKLASVAGLLAALGLVAGWPLQRLSASLSRRPN